MTNRNPLPLLTQAVPPIVLESAQTILLLHDLHAPFADAENGWLAAKARQKVLTREFDDYFDGLVLMTGNIATILASCRAHTIPAYYSCLGFFAPNSPSLFQTATGWKWELNGPDGAFPEAWQPNPNEPIFAKPGWSALANETLQAHLRNKQIRTVILIGTMLEFGIRQTAIDLADRGYHVLIIADAVVPLTLAGQRPTVGSLAHGLIKLRSTGEFCDLLDRLPAEKTVII